MIRKSYNKKYSRQGVLNAKHPVYFLLKIRDSQSVTCTFSKEKAMLKGERRQRI